MEQRFNGYVHAKVIPGTSPELVDRLGRLADRLSVNLELPSRASLASLCPDKDARSVMAPMAQIATTRNAEEQALLDSPAGRKALARRCRHGKASSHVSEGMRVTSVGSQYTLGRPVSAVPNALRSFAPAGQSTQIIVGASPEDDNHILQLSKSLYDHYGLKRIFFSAYMPMVEDSRLHARRACHPGEAMARPRRRPKARMGARAHGGVPRRGHGRVARDAPARPGDRAGWRKAHPRGAAYKTAGHRRPSGARHRSQACALLCDLRWEARPWGTSRPGAHTARGGERCREKQV